MIVAGFGFRQGASSGDILAALDAALAAHGRREVAALATSQDKAAEPGLLAAGRALGRPVTALPQEKLLAVAHQTLTRSDRSMEATGLPSLSEAAALAAAGEAARLLGPRVVVGAATCALAEGGAA
ncbi:MAG: cobalamin biosynthesis protein [Geminicoccaceae bacterium]